STGMVRGVCALASAERKRPKARSARTTFLMFAPKDRADGPTQKLDSAKFVNRCSEGKYGSRANIPISKPCVYTSIERVFGIPHMLNRLNRFFNKFLKRNSSYAPLLVA